MRVLSGVFGTLISLALLALLGRWLGLGGYVRESVAAGHLLDWVMGALCLAWLLVLLKAPWDLYFQAHAVAFEQVRARERGIALAEGRAEYVETVRKRLLIFALGAHALSALLAAAVAFFTSGTIGYWFSAFFLISTLFRPLLAGYGYLWSRLQELLGESKHPREDIVELRERLSESQEISQREISELRGRLSSIGREFETSLSRLTDQKAVIDGLQAIVRLIARSAAE
jgi:hypothetical protein